MKFEKAVSVQWLANLTESKVLGDASALATGINELHRVENGDVVFVDHPKYYDKVLNSNASIIIINKEVIPPAEKTLLVHDNPFEAYTKIIKYFKPIHKQTTLINEQAVIGNTSFLFPNVYVGKNVTIGEHCIIHPNVVIYDDVQIGDHVIIHANTVVGSDAFYYNTKKAREVWYEKMLTAGNVIIEDYVEIGAGCTIDSGVTHSTIIGKGSKLDNQIHIGHDVVLGANSLLAAQVGIAGMTVFGDGCTVWGQVGVSKTLHIGNNVTILAKSGVGSDIADGKTYFGIPAEDALTKKKELVWIKRIPEMWQKLMKEKS